MNEIIPVSSIGERPLITRLCEIFKTAASPEIILGAGADDCAVIDITDEDCLVVTTDMLHRTTDFPPQMSAWQIGWMVAAVNLSDVAAMGARPVGILSALGFPADTDVEFVEEMARGMADCAAICDVPVIGGDIDTHEELTITGTAIGRMRKRELLRRNGAQVGDKVCVTGYAGSAGLALCALAAGAQVSGSLLRVLFEPVPRTGEAQKLAASGAVTSMMDISDGLALSLYDIAGASSVGFRIYENALPVQEEVRTLVTNANEVLELALYTGGDFELLFTVRPDMIEAAQDACSLCVIGEVFKQEEDIMIERADGTIERVDRKGYEQLENRS